MKNNRGITLVTLVVTIILILILTAIVVTNTYTGSDYKKYKLMCADVELLEDKVLIYYNKYGKLPIIDEDGQVLLTDMTNDLAEKMNVTHEYWKIDTSRLNGITLNYGDDEDIYFIDTTTFEVYYLNGIEYEEVIYYTD